MKRMWYSTRVCSLWLSCAVLTLGCTSNDQHPEILADARRFARNPPAKDERVTSLSTAIHTRQARPSTSFEVQPAASAQAVQSGHTPPTGWEIPKVVAKKTTTTNPEDAPACCGFDKLCCSRQSDIDRGIRVPARKNFSVAFSKVPESTVKERTKDGPPIEGFTGIKVVDGAGTPFPWINGPQQFEVRLIPEGKVGYLRFGKDFSSAHYGDPQYRSIGYGLTIPINPTPDKGKSLIKGPLEYWTFNAGSGDQIIVDHVQGQLDGTPEVIGERWEHGLAINGAEGIVHVYRALHEGKPHVFFLLPEVIIGFESPYAKTFGGTGNDRFASDFPYTLYRFPLGPGHSDTINCIVREYEIRRWFPRPKNGLKLPDGLPMIISMSQTSVEAEPQIRIMFL